MKTIRQQTNIEIVGIELRTNNLEAARTIPAFWNRFYSEGIPERIEGKVSGAVYGVYTRFENEGRNNEGQYSLILGCEVSGQDSTVRGRDLVHTTIPGGERLVFEVEKGRMDKVGEKWMEIWSYNERRKNYVSDYERYDESGDIAIFVGVR